MEPLMTSGLTLLLFAASLSVSVVALADDKPRFALKGGETIVFFGDSITQNGGYVNYFEAFLLTRFPQKTFNVVNRGISSETISGTSEEDHAPRRPWALPRFSRDVAKLKPDVVVACFGMNDGNYHPFEKSRFQAYQKGIRSLIDQTKKETKAKLILMTPPPYDPYRRRVGDPNAKSYGYKFAAVDYDETLRRYSEWLVSLRKEDRTVVDLHTQMNEHLKIRRTKDVSYSFSPDAVHPNPTGHWLMTQGLLEELGETETPANVRIDGKTGKTTSDAIADFKPTPDGGATFSWKAPLPMPHDPAWDARSIELKHVEKTLNACRISVTELNDVSHTLVVDGKPLIKATAREFAAGIPLLHVDGFPTVKSGRELLKLVKERRSLRYRLWRMEIDQPLGRPLDEKRIDSMKARLAELNRQIDALRKPVKLQIAVHPAAPR